ncbi:unnamed protein product [Pleuronectes platessa]|uniref:Uncharacterized protein n=1 Tax=Pleuronectes platessa TaxID=8262 RepID=A0A9N7VC07_PLEPL|nr:unnamed protein product [Pleuronectes platessa]
MKMLLLFFGGEGEDSTRAQLPHWWTGRYQASSSPMGERVRGQGWLGMAGHPCSSSNGRNVGFQSGKLQFYDSDNAENHLPFDPGRQTIGTGDISLGKRLCLTGTGSFPTAAPPMCPALRVLEQHGLEIINPHKVHWELSDDPDSPGLLSPALALFPLGVSEELAQSSFHFWRQITHSGDTTTTTTSTTTTTTTITITTTITTTTSTKSCSRAVFVINTNHFVCEADFSRGFHRVEKCPGSVRGTSGFQLCGEYAATELYDIPIESQ